MNSTMFLVSLENFAPLTDAAFILSHISHEVDVKISRAQFLMITTDRYRRFVTALHIWEPFFVEYSIEHDINSRISLRFLRNTLQQAEEDHYSTMTIHMDRIRSHNYLSLQFRNLSSLRKHELWLSASEEEDLGQIQIDYENFFKINSDDFRHLIREVAHFPHFSVWVTVTYSQVKFSFASKEIILTQESGRCEIIGYEGEMETRYRIFPHPMPFFFRLLSQTDVVWFHRTINNFGLICIPTAECYMDYVIHFPPM